MQCTLLRGPFCGNSYRYRVTLEAQRATGGNEHTRCMTVKKQRLAIRITAGLATAGILAFGAVAPAAGATGSHRTIVPAGTSVRVTPGTVMIAADTGWN